MKDSRKTSRGTQVGLYTDSATFNQVNKVSGTGTEQENLGHVGCKHHQCKIEWESLWSQLCGDLNHIGSQPPSQGHIVLLPRISTCSPHLSIFRYHPLEHHSTKTLISQKWTAQPGGIHGWIGGKLQLSGHIWYRYIFLTSTGITSENGNWQVLSKHSRSPALAPPWLSTERHLSNSERVSLSDFPYHPSNEFEGINEHLNIRGNHCILTHFPKAKGHGKEETLLSELIASWETSWALLLPLQGESRWEGYC